MSNFEANVKNAFAKMKEFKEETLKRLADFDSFRESITAKVGMFLAKEEIQAIIDKRVILAEANIKDIKDICTEAFAKVAQMEQEIEALKKQNNAPEALQEIKVEKSMKTKKATPCPEDAKVNNKIATKIVANLPNALDEETLKLFKQEVAASDDTEEVVGEEDILTDWG